MIHEALTLTADEERALKQQFWSLAGSLSHPMPSHVLSVNLLYHSSAAMEDNLKRLWRY